MIVTYTDFGLSGPYVGQMKAVLHGLSPSTPIIDLLANAPVHDIRANAYLLDALIETFPQGSIFLAVVDPGVGSNQRQPVVVKCDGNWFVGPGNGLFDVIMKRSEKVEAWQITWRPEHLSSSFHGRDLFAPIAAMLANGEMPEMEPLEVDRQRLSAIPEALGEIIYIDHFGNLFTGIRASSVSDAAALRYKGVSIPRVNTFFDVPAGSPLCYKNSSGLMEIALNQGRAADHFSAQLGECVDVFI